MEIRSVTLFCNPDFPSGQAGAFLSAARERFPQPLQSCRVALPPFPGWWPRNGASRARAEEAADLWGAVGADYVSVGPVQLQHEAHWLQELPQIVGASDIVFASAEVADCQGRIAVDRCATVGGIIRQASTLLDNGFANLYFAALANCPPGSPFFPAAYHDPSQQTGFALAVEAANLAMAAVAGADTLAMARSNLVSAIERHAQELTETALELAREHDMDFRGIDFCLAPFPDKERSIVGAMEGLGLSAAGAPGTLFTAALMTDAIDRASFRRCGFSGLMLPVLEDDVLAQRAGEGLVSLSDLLTYASVCGTGLDTVPLPGNISETTLAGILLDVAALATRLDKPLTARLMPLPGKAAGDAVRFDFPYFAESRVMAVAESGLGGLLSHAGEISLRSNHE